jgi:hypothetical protein
MLMVCPNCKSNDIVAIQNQHYCLNCGQLVPEAIAPAGEPVAAPAEADLAAKIAGTPLKIAANMPAVGAEIPVKALPKVKKAMSEPKPRPLDAAPPMIRKHFDVALRPVKKTAVASASKPVKPAPPKEPIRPPRPIIAHTTALAPPVDSLAKSTAPINTREIAMPAKEHSRHNFHTILVLLSALTAVSGFALAISLGPNPIWLLVAWVAGDIPTVTISLNLVAIAGLAVGLIWLCYSLFILAQAALTFSKGRRAAGRPTSDDSARAVARASFGGILRLDLLILFWLGVLAIIEVALVRYVLAVTSQTTAAQPYLLAASSLIVLFFLVNLIASRNLGVVNLVITNASPRKALRRGRQLFYRHTVDIIVGMLITLIVSLVFALPAFCTWLWLKMTPGTDGLRVYLTAAWLVLTALGIYLIANYFMNFWSRLYLEIVASLPSDQAATMHGGRKASLSRRPSVFIGATFVLALALIAAGAWYTGWAAHLSEYFHGWLIR